MRIYRRKERQEESTTYMDSQRQIGFGRIPYGLATVTAKDITYTRSLMTKTGPFYGGGRWAVRIKM